MVKYLLAILLALPLLASAQKRLLRPATRTTVTTTTANAAAPAQVLRITGPCAVIYAPNEAKMNRLRQQYGESNINTSADDNHTFVAKSRAYLQDKGIRVVETTATQLHFATAAGPGSDLDLSGLAFSWGLLLFNGHDAPQEANLADPANDVQSVLKK